LRRGGKPRINETPISSKKLKYKYLGQMHVTHNARIAQEKFRPKRALRTNSTHAHADRGLDAYWMGPEAVKALLRIETLPKRIHDPCCGNGAILDVLEAAGHHVSGADIPGTIVRDFLASPCDLRDTAVVTNPPYRLALPFIDKILDGGSPYTAFLLRLSFLDPRSKAKPTKKPNFDDPIPAGI
jgi:hypothetical protein